MAGSTPPPAVVIADDAQDPDWKSNRFLVPGILLAVAVGLYVAGQNVVRSGSEETAMIGVISTCIAAPTCLFGIIGMAYALGKPKQKVTFSVVMQDVSNPIVSRMPVYNQFQESKSQNLGGLMVSLSILIIFGAVILAIVSVFSSLGAGLGGSGGSCDEFCEGTMSMAYYSCYGGILLFVAGLLALARPWAWFGEESPNVVVVPANTTPQADLSSFTVAQLKDQLKQKGLPVSGKKDELIQRLKGGVEPAKEIEKVTVSCGECGKGLKVPSDYEGRIKCPKCGSISTV